MSARTYEVIKSDVSQATSINDTDTLERCATELDNIGTVQATALANSARGMVSELRGDFPTALEHFRRALSLFVERGDLIAVANVTADIGVVHMDAGDYPLALEYFNRSVAMHGELGNRRGVAVVTGNIGIVYFNTGNYPAALEHFRRALAVHEELGYRSSMARAYGNIGNVFRETGDYPRALEHMHRALALHEQLGDSNGAAQVTGNIIGTLILVENPTEAVRLLARLDAMEIVEPQITVIRELHRAALQTMSGELEAAAGTLKNALDVVTQFDIRAQRVEVHKAYCDLAQKRNDFASYIEHNNNYTRIIEAINGKETAAKIAIQEKQREIDAREKEHERHMAVLHSTLPKHVAERVARGEVVNDQFENATVIFLDIVGFTELSSSMSSQDVITLLDTIFTQCDAICEKHNVVKIKTIGDSYMCVSFDSVINAARAALEMMKIESRIKNQESNQGMLQFRIGMHCGSLTAGVIGTQRMQYDVWGDTVNVASRMESTGEPGRIHVSQAFALNLKSNQESKIKNPISESHEVSHTSVAHQRRTEFHSVAQSEIVTRHSSLVTIERGSFDIKGKGLMKTYWLESSTT